MLASSQAVRRPCSNPLFTALLLAISACAGGREVPVDSDDGPNGGRPPLGGDGTGASGAGELVGPGEGGAPLDPGPAGSVCLALDVAALPPDFAPYATDCATTDPYACVDDLGCGYAGSLEEPAGFVIRARLDLGALDDFEAWPPAGTRVRVGARTFGPTVTGELKLGYGVFENGDRGFYQETSDGVRPQEATISFESLAQTSSPPTRDVLLCYDGLVLEGVFFISPSVTLQFDQPTPAGSERVELLLEVAALPGVDVLGSIEILEVETFELGRRFCDGSPFE